MKKVFWYRFLVLVFVVCPFLFVIPQADAQFAQTDISFSTDPISPAPNEQVEVTIESLSYNLNNYFITWYLDGRKEQGNYGMTSFSFVTGGVGEASEVSVVIQINASQVIRKNLTISPVEIDLIWEADTYVPPFYRGKALPNRESNMKVVAIPQTATITPNNAYDLIYYWRKNRKSVPTESGYGRQAYSFEKNILNSEENISVMIEDRNGITTAEKSIDLEQFFKPEIIMYLRDDEGRLLTNKALEDNTKIVSLPFTISAEPYYFSRDIENITFDWNINGQDIFPEQELTKTDITLYPETGVNSAQIKVGVENSTSLYENSNATLLISI